jgi:ABC-type branched-subunit amino acid transport system permease subunit
MAADDSVPGELRVKAEPPRAMSTERVPAWIKRLLACLAGSVVLAIMWGPQEGSQTDYGYAFRTAVFHPRVFLFLGIGVILFLAITFWPKVVPYLIRPGVWPLVSGTLTVIASYTLMHWYDPVGKFSALATAVSATSGLSWFTTAYFSWMHWALVFLSFVAIGMAIVSEQRFLAWMGAGIAAIGAVLSYTSHYDVVNFRAGSIDHSLGFGVAVVGYLVMALAGSIVAMSELQTAQTQAFVNRVLGWRPGFPLVALGAVVGLIGLWRAVWFSPGHYNANLADTKSLFDGTDVTTVTSLYLSWLGWLLFVLVVAGGVAASFRRMRGLGWAVAVVGVVATVLTLYTIYDLSNTAASLHVDSATGPWQNLGTGGWITSAAFFLIAGAGFIVATTGRRGQVVTTDAEGHEARIVSTSGGGYFTAPGAGRGFVLVAIAAALFYPPTMTTFWQAVIVSEIGIYVLLAIGLNVVVGWAGLLDLGYIAFYAIGSYTTAYLTGSLPVDPPKWLQLSPLLAMPFAVLICLIAGVILGAPTLRLRGDYLAIVTLGFGEIIQVAANNADGFTNGSRGTAVDPPRGVHNVPNPSVHLGPINITWGLNQLQYWYLLLILIVIVLIAFSRLENSRLGRAWAAIREDEVAAEATGINAFRVKLLAFAIGASTSGIAGVFFASQIGFITPDNFILNNSILVVAYVVFGGAGSLPGAVAGAALLTWLPEFLKDQVPQPDRQMWIGALLLLMMIFRPGGLIPARRRQAELHGLDTTPTAETVAVAASEGM